MNINVDFQLGKEVLGRALMDYTINPEGGINLVGMLFGGENTHIPQRYINCDAQGNPKSTMICIADGLPNRLVSKTNIPPTKDRDYWVQM